MTVFMVRRLMQSLVVLLIMSLIKQEAIVPLMAAQSVISTLLYALLLALVTIRLYKREALLG